MNNRSKLAKSMGRAGVLDTAAAGGYHRPLDANNFLEQRILQLSKARLAPLPVKAAASGAMPLFKQRVRIDKHFFCSFCEELANR